MRVLDLEGKPLMKKAEQQSQRDEQDYPSQQPVDLPRPPLPIDNADEDDSVRPYREQEEHQRQLPRQRSLMPTIRMNALVTQAALDRMEAEGRPII